MTPDQLPLHGHRDAAPPTEGLITVVLCTWNRANLLPGALEALTRQADAPPHEVIVVDNASTDATAEVVGRYAERHAEIRYVFEARAGLSHARNAGVAAARGAIIAFTDDDVRVHRRWMATLAETAKRYPAAACFGGPVLPDFPASAPQWLTEAHWSPLGVQNYSTTSFRVDEQRPICLIGANLAIRRATFAIVGEFDPAVQRVGNGIGSTEDFEYHTRLWRASQFGMYEPTLSASAVVTPDRMTKRYHRAWHYGHGRHIARMRIPDIEATPRKLFGVPAHVVRQAAIDAWRWGLGTLGRDPAAAFTGEVGVYFALGFIKERWSR